MSSPRTLLIALVALTVAACSAGPATQPTAIAQATMPSATAAPAVTPNPPKPEPTPKPTPVPVPPKPTGLKFVAEDESLCGDEPPPPGDTCGIGDTIYTLSWKAPRTKGVEIRVYGLLACLNRPENPPDSSDGPCLVKGTKLPSSAKKLIAKAKASDGFVSWRGDINAGGCDMAEQFIGPHGEVFYAIVLAAYNTAGKPSVFAIADPGEWWTLDPGDVPC